MNIIHFDVDQEVTKYLEGEKQPHTLQEITNFEKFKEVEVVTFHTSSKASKEILSQFPKLKLVVARTVGTDHIDLEYCKEKEIPVYHVEDYGSFNIAEHGFALLLAGSRNILDSQKQIKKGAFSYESLLGVSLKGKRMGVVGTGKIGLEMIKRAVGFEMEIVAFDVFKNDNATKELGFTYMSLEELTQTSDVVSLHAPLLPSTKHMINEDIIMKMKDGAILINTARGGLIDTSALVKHIKKFRFVGLDVLEDEDKFTADHPLLKHDHVVITPHMAFYSDASVRKIAEETAKLIKNYESGNPQGKVV